MRKLDPTVVERLTGGHWPVAGLPAMEHPTPGEQFAPPAGQGYSISMWPYLWGSFLHALGVAWRSLGNWRGSTAAHERAARLMSRAVATDPRLLDARYDRAVLLWRELGRPAAAVAELDLLLAADPDYAPAYLNRGLARQEIGQFAAALRDLNAFLSHPARLPHYVATAERVAAELQALLDETPPP